MPRCGEGTDVSLGVGAPGLYDARMPPGLPLRSLASLLVAFVSRVVPQINVMEVGVTARIAIGFGALLLFAPLLAPALDGLYARLMNGLDLALDVIAV